MTGKDVPHQEGELRVQISSAGARLSGKVPLPEALFLYDALERRISQVAERERRPIWILIEAYHSGGKTYTAERLRERFRAAV